MSDYKIDVGSKILKFPTGMVRAAIAELSDVFMIQKGNDLGGDPQTLTLEQVKALFGGGGGGTPSTDPIFNTAHVTGNLTVGGNIVMEDVMFDVFREGIRTYIRAEDKLSPDNEEWLDAFAAIFTKMITNSMQTDNWQRGISGGSLWKDEQGSSHLEVDYGVFRKKATFTNLVIQELKHQAGQVVITPVNMKIDRVVETDRGYECYPEEGSTVDFIQYDQARCQKFEVGQSKYYWRLVEAVTGNYALLSKTDQDGNGDAPEPGDEIVLFGHRNDANPSRQCAILLDSASGNAPTIQMFSRLGSSVDGDPYNMYGRMAGYFGKDPQDPSSCVIVCNKGRFENIAIGPGCTGLDNFAEYDRLVDQVGKAQSVSVDIMPDPSPAFITDKDGNITPENITVRVSENNFNSDLGGVRKWYFLTSEGFQLIEDETEKHLVIRPNDVYWNNKTSLSVMYEVDMEGKKYSDVTSLIKIADGANGVASYMAVLDNPYVGVSTDFQGVIKQGQLGINGRVRTYVIAYKGITMLSYSPNPGEGQYNFKIKSSTGCDAMISPNGLYMYVDTFFSDLGRVVLEVNFEGKRTMDLVFNCGKTYDGALSSEEIKGDPGDPAYSMDLDNDNVVVATEPDGSGGYWGENAMTTAMVMKGGVDISSKYMFAISAQPDSINFTATNSSRTAQVKGMDVDDGFLQFVAMPKSTSDPDTYNAPTLQKRFNISKSKQGIQGIRGPGGYIWIVYADDEIGTGITSNPAGKKYIGIAYGKEKPEPTIPLNPSDYEFSLLTGEGVPGPPGSDRFMWIKFSTTYPVTNVNQVTNDGSAEGLKYMLLAYNQVNEEEDTFPPGEEQVINPKYYNTYYTATEYRGKDGESLQVQYSANGTSWHNTFQVTDIFMRQKMSDGITWSEPMRIVGEEGQDGQYTNYQFSKTTSMEVAPTTGWQDGPPSLLANEFLWMRKGVVIPPALDPAEWSNPVVLSGPSGSSYWIVPSTNFINMLSGVPNPNVVRFTARRGSVSDGVTGWSLGFWRVYYSKDNQKTWVNQSTTTQLPYIDVTIDSSWTNVRAELYFDKGMVNLCSSEVILIQDVSGIPGKSNYVADFSNEVGSTNVNADGTGGYWGDNMKTTLTIYYGIENITNKYTVTVSADAEYGIDFVKSVGVNGSSVTVQVNGMTGADTGYVKFTCVPQDGLEGAITLEKMFQVVKIPAGEKGDKGDASLVQLQYAPSANGPWEDTYSADDLFLRQLVNGVPGEAMRFIGEDGEPGEDGSYTDFMFAISASIDTYPTAESEWHDGPQSTTTAKPYAWMRTRVVNGNGTMTAWEYGRLPLPGEEGPPGPEGDPGSDGAGYWISIDTNQVSVKDGIFNPKTIKMDVWKGMNDSGVVAYNAAVIEVEYSFDYMKTWTRESLMNNSSTYTLTIGKVYDPAQPSVMKMPTNYRFSAYYDTEQTKLLDSETVPVIDNDLNDVTSLDYLKFALKQLTTIEGGLVSTTSIRLGYSQTLAESPESSSGSLPTDWKETAGMYGGSTLVPGEASSLTRTRFRNTCPRFYSGTNMDDTDSSHTAFWYAQQALTTATTALGLDMDTYNPTGCTFAVSDSGILYAKNCYIEGKIIADSGKIGELIVDGGGLSYGLTSNGPQGTSYYKFRMYGGGMVFREDWSSTRNSYDRQIALGASGVVPSTSGLDPLFMASINLTGSYSSSGHVMWLDIKGGTRNLTMMQGPQAIRVQNGDIHIENGYLTLNSSSVIFTKGLIRSLDSWMDFETAAKADGNYVNGGINFKGPRKRIVYENVKNISMTGTDPGVTILNESNFIVLTGSGKRKKVTLSSSNQVGTWHIIISTQNVPYDVQTDYDPNTKAGDHFYYLDSHYRAVQSNGRDATLVFKHAQGEWVAAHLPTNWLDAWGKIS